MYSKKCCVQYGYLNLRGILNQRHWNDTFLRNTTVQSLSEESHMTLDQTNSQQIRTSHSQNKNEELHIYLTNLRFNHPQRFK